MTLKPVISPGMVQAPNLRPLIVGGYTQAPLRTLVAGGLANVSVGVPFPVIASLVARWEADQAIGLSKGDPVDTLPDLSGNALDLTASGTARPTWNASDASFNNKPSLTFDGTSNTMTNQSMPAMGTAVTVLDVLKVVSPMGGFGKILSFHAAALAEDGPSNIRGFYGEQVYKLGISSFGTVEAAQTYLTTGFTSRMVFTSASVTHQVSGAAPTTADAGTLTGTNTVWHFMGSNAGLNGFTDFTIAARFVFDEDLSNGDLMAMYAYIESKYGIANPDPDVFNYLTRVTANGGTLSATEITAVTDFVESMKAEGLWDKMVEVGMFNGDFAAFPVKLKVATGVDDVLVNSGFIAGQYDRYTGITTDGVNDLLTGVVPADHGMTGANQAAGVYLCRASGTGIALGAAGFYMGWADAHTAAMSGVTISGTAGQAERLMTLTTDGADVKLYLADALDVTATHTSSDATNAVRIGSFIGSFQADDQQVQGYFLSEGLSSTEVATLSGLWDTFMEARISAAPVGIVFFGDSITFGLNATTDADSYANIVASGLGLTEINSGISGTTLQSPDPDFAANDGRTNCYSRISARRPSKVHIQYGVVDIIQTVAGGYTPANFQAQLEEVIDIILATSGLTVNDICIGSPSYITAYSGDGSDVRAAAYAAAAEAAATVKGTRFADVYAATFEHPEYLDDGIHPNDAGMAVIASTILAAFA